MNNPPLIIAVCFALSEGLFSVTPEVIAAHHAKKLSRLLEGPPSAHTILDLFTGVGGNCIQLALAGFNGKRNLILSTLTMHLINATQFPCWELVAAFSVIRRPTVRREIPGLP